MTITLQAVNELIQSLESAGELSIKERKYLELAKGYADKEAESVAQALTFEKCRELSGCPAGVDLQDWVKQLAAESVGLKGIVSEINNELYGQGFQVAGWHLNGALEPLDNWFTDNGWGEPETPSTDSMIARIKASAIPEGFKLVPEQMYLSDEDIQAVCTQCGNGDKKGYGDYEDGILWVGELSNDGEVKYGLNIANANYPEEGSITVFEFDEPLREGADK
ncbi:TPA: hypothetical protein ACNV2H_004345 [Klebsiella aerogenes]